MPLIFGKISRFSSLGMENTYFRRIIDDELLRWSRQKQRKPLLLRGARQVGKSSAVKELAKQFETFVSINFERLRTIHHLFESDLEPRRLCEQLSAFLNIPIIPGKTLLFFDEVQSCPAAISSLRYFYEEYPELHVIAAGSLLEFALEELPSFGVGRIRSIFMYPFSFDEFLEARGLSLLKEAKGKASPEMPLPEPIHQKLQEELKKFLVLGGMPEVVKEYVINSDILACQQVLDDLIISLQSDFSKYKQRVPSSRLQDIFESAAQQSGNSFVYSRVSTEANQKQVKEGVDLLVKAGLLIPVYSTAANGIPLGAEINPKKRKLIFLDTGLLQRILGLKISDILFANDFSSINKGAIAEQYAGLELLKSASCYELQQRLYYWQREKLNSNAEVDYLIQEEEKIIPIEVKAGTKGSMQSLHLFLGEKNVEKGIRTSLENFGRYGNIDVYPLYALRNIRET